MLAYEANHTMWFKDEPIGSWGTCDARNQQGRGMIVGAKCSDPTFHELLSLKLSSQNFR